MSKDQREITRKLRILRHAEETGHVAKTCRYFGVLEFQNEVQHPRLDMISGRLEEPEECCSGNI